RRARTASSWSVRCRPPTPRPASASSPDTHRPSAPAARLARRSCRQTTARRARSIPSPACGGTAARRPRRTRRRGRRTRGKGSKASRPDLLYGLENGLARVRPLARGAFVDELLEVRAHRHLGGREQFLADLLAIDALGELARGAAAARELGPHLGFTVEAMRPVLLQLAHRVRDRVPVARKEDVR